MRGLTVLYDPSCAFCRRAAAWLALEPSYLPLRLIPAGSERAQRAFPELSPAATLCSATVVSDEGLVYRSAAAWVVVLWALREYRGWSVWLSKNGLSPWASYLVSWVSKHRHKPNGNGAAV